MTSDFYSAKGGKLKECFEEKYEWTEVACERVCSEGVFQEWIYRLSSFTIKGYLDWTVYDSEIWTSYNTTYKSSNIRIYILHKDTYLYTSDTILVKENENRMYCYKKGTNHFDTDIATSPGKKAIEVIQIPELRHLAELIAIYNKERKDGTILQKNVERRLKRSDTIAITYSFACTQKNHSIMPYCGIVPILSFDNHRIEEKVYLGYCRQCDVFYMFSRDYKNLKKKGTILCKVISMSSGDVEYDSNLLRFNNAESILAKYGYNVQLSKNLSFDERKEILDRIISDKAMSIHNIINILEMEIHLNRRKRNYSNAVSKWEMDVDYLKNYGISSGREEYLSEEGHGSFEL